MANGKWLKSKSKWLKAKNNVNNNVNNNLDDRMNSSCDSLILGNIKKIQKHD